MRRILMIMLLCLVPSLSFAQSAPSITITPPRIETSDGMTLKQVAVVVAAVAVGAMAGQCHRQHGRHLDRGRGRQRRRPVGPTLRRRDRRPGQGGRDGCNRCGVTEVTMAGPLRVPVAWTELAMLVLALVARRRRPGQR
jgi:MYXO-CTERM domain-containing protein